jgi:peptide/nickel transport system permease protein
MAEATAPAAAPAKKASGRPDALHLLLNNTLATGGLVVFALIVFSPRWPRRSCRCPIPM